MTSGRSRSPSRDNWGSCSSLRRCTQRSAGELQPWQNTERSGPWSSSPSERYTPLLARWPRRKQSRYHGSFAPFLGAARSSPGGARMSATHHVPEPLELEMDLASLASQAAIELDDLLLGR